MIALNFDSSAIDRTIAELAATEREAAAALRTTTRRMATWLRTRIQRAMRSNGIPAKVVRRRLVRARVERRGEGIVARVWVGLDPVNLIEFGRRQTRAGVRTRRGTRPGTFIAAPSGTAQIFKRRGRGRLPIDKQTEAIAVETNRSIDQIVADGAFDRQFMDTFERELSWRIGRRR